MKFAKGKGRLTILVGGQFGSEGKGQIAYYLHQRQPYTYAVRVGGPNAGHTFYYPNGIKQVVQSLPCAAMDGAIGVVGAGGLILPEVLDKELYDAWRLRGEQPARVLLDENAVIIRPAHLATEQSGLVARIGSTGEGVGAATAAKIMREESLTVGQLGLSKLGVDVQTPWWEGVLTKANTGLVLNLELLQSPVRVMLEGTQGYGLSLHTGGFYPRCTSRQCTPQGLLSETGVNPANARLTEVILVLRTFPIRVAGNSGPLEQEITWEELQAETGGYVAAPEITTVTKKVRRIGRMDWNLVDRAILECRPTGLALTFFDYLHPDAAGLTEPDALSKQHWETIQQWEGRLGVPILYLSTGPGRTMSLRVTK